MADVAKLINQRATSLYVPQAVSNPVPFPVLNTIGNIPNGIPVSKATVGSIPYKPIPVPVDYTILPLAKDELSIRLPEQKPKEFPILNIPDDLFTEMNIRREDPRLPPTPPPRKNCHQNRQQDYRHAQEEQKTRLPRIIFF